MSLEDLDRLLALRVEDAQLAAQLAQPLGVQELCELAAARGLEVGEADILSAQQREESRLSQQQLQERVAQEARRLRHFIQG
ncbi:Nif11-like leader peptide family natural product precursor [Synechococcus sp. BS55D]|uniref:Nif11-like leader peptide family natural product precursor n=1 Tax=Synechococcus sp. BS55D TaxID=2055943 RepID=UPI0010388ED6|nr:Nif11-like leader peptide family natural product precursor [Synechococcus sp. BS55D]TCD56498.1 bacteriocin [Synechococcus sp. BS55D]